LLILLQYRVEKLRTYPGGEPTALDVGFQLGALDHLVMANPVLTAKFCCDNEGLLFSISS